MKKLIALLVLYSGLSQAAYSPGPAYNDDNLSKLESAATARTNLGVAASTAGTYTAPTVATSLTASYATASTVPYFDSSKNLVSSAVTPTELGYVGSVTSAIQTQLNAKAPAAAPAFTGAMTATGTFTGDGGDALSGFLSKQVASTSVTITAAQCGSTFISNSADVMQLPEASTVLGCRLTFVCGTADDFDVNPQDSPDQIGPKVQVVAATSATELAPSAGDAIRCTDIGSSIVLEAVGADLWAPVGVAAGPWTDVN